MSSEAKIKNIDLMFKGEPTSGSKLRNEIHVWRIYIPGHIGWIEEKKYLLSKAESKKFAGFFRQQDKDLFLAGKILAKILSAQYLDCAPEEVEFSHTQNQKPFIEADNFHFNTAHSGDWAVLIFSETPCGVDIEKIDPEFDYSEVMEISFHQEEINAVNKAEDPISEFYKIWTDKESILKAEGTGIIENLSQMNVLEGNRRMPDNPEASWQTKNYPLKDYSLSITYKKSPFEIKFFEFESTLKKS